jgi:carbohydrate-selective porin OprB
MEWAHQLIVSQGIGVNEFNTDDHEDLRAAPTRPIAFVFIWIVLAGLFSPLRAQDNASPSFLPAIPQRDYLAGDYDGIRTRLYAQGIDLFANYQGEVFGNVSGGSILDSLGQTRNVASYDGLLTFGVNLDLGKLIGWSGAKVFFSVEAQSANRHSVDFPISKSAGAFIFSELGFRLNSNNGGLPGTYAAAAFYHTGTRADVGYRPNAVKDGDYGIFFMADQMVWRQNNDPAKKGAALGLWTRIGGAPAERNLVSFYADGGVSLLAPLAVTARLSILSKAECWYSCGQCRRSRS